MLKRLGSYSILALLLLLLAASARAQLGNSGSIEGQVKDQSGAAVANATVEIAYGVSGFQRTTTTGSDDSRTCRSIHITW